MSLTKVSYSMITGTPVNILDFGADSTGVTDSTTAINNALTAGAGGAVFIPAGTYKTTATLNIPTQTTVYGVGKGSIISCTNGGVSQFSIDGKTKCQVRDISIVSTGVGTAAYVAGVRIYNGSNLCLVEKVYFSGMSWAGVLISESNECQVHKCHFTDWQGTVQDSSDVCIYNNSSLNIIADNRMFGGGHHGVLMQDPYAGLIPTRNLISGNRIGQHAAYGVAIYAPGLSGSGDSYNQIIGNFIENIQGSVTTNRSSGAGVYIAGAYSGATVIANNVIYNCCVQTLDRSLSPAGIGINGVPSTCTPCSVTGNSISNMAQGDGILITSSTGGATISNNTILIPSSNDGTGVGGATLLGSGIRIETSNNIAISAGVVQNNGTGNALFLYANGTSISNITVAGGVYSTTGTGNAVRAAQLGSVSVNNLSMSGVRATVSNSASTPFQLSYINFATLVGLIGTANAGAGYSLDISNCTYLRISGGYFTGSSSANIGTTGTCTGSFIDKTAYIGASNSLIVNAGTGFNIETRGNAVPTTGQWQVGDHVIQSVPAVGSPKGWFCTVSGTSGTWVSEGNL